MSEWQPIETAPKDGTMVIVPGGIAYWRPEGWFTLTGVEWPGRQMDWEPARWMPFPEEPK